MNQLTIRWGVVAGDIAVALVSLGIAGLLALSSLTYPLRWGPALVLALALGWMGLAIWQVIRVIEITRLRVEFSETALSGTVQRPWDAVTGYRLRLWGGRATREKGAGLMVLSLYGAEGRLLTIDSRLAPLRPLLALLRTREKAGKLEAADPRSAEWLRAFADEGWGEIQ
jgi:hypothetical protein